eukprot:TRINITY_DN9878_c0_g1_i14.p1 TRINITY_DN9878_c0_g1~~TRINITY_DN9878_c0_g1_i14.p1  ORF type:complete len:436 (-),score=64.52 TRINITY_DN9878_c0_g1_i14:330-1637(-)
MTASEAGVAAGSGGSDTFDQAPVRLPSAFQVHGALIVAQVLFGCGSVVGKLGVATFNPMLFALIREGVAGPLLLTAAVVKEGKSSKIHFKDLALFAICGFCLFTNQAMFIIGDKLAGPVVGSAWQCSQAVFTLLISLTLGWEKPTVLKILGIAVSLAGGTFMVLYGQNTSSRSSFFGNILFALNCLGTALYVIFSKIALRKFSSLTTTAWSYACASVMTAILALILNHSCDFIRFVCPVDADHMASYKCDSHPTSCSPWQVPTSALLPLAYWIFGTSMLSYSLMTWANQYAKAGYVLAYTALQPFSSMLLSTTIILVVGPSNTTLKMPGVNALGGLGVVAGLLFILKGGKKEYEEEVTEDSIARPQCSQTRRSSVAEAQSSVADVGLSDEDKFLESAVCELQEVDESKGLRCSDEDPEGHRLLEATTLGRSLDER